MNKLNLPCLRGNIGDWTYFSTVMRVKDICEGRRISLVTENEDLNTKNINRILQRALDRTRINKIKRYLLTSDERFFSSLIVAIHGGDPLWSDIEIRQTLRINEEDLSEGDIEFIGKKFGILTLSGAETIFALDGQHRLTGIRAAYVEDASLADEEIPIVLVVHRPGNRERTRRLFTVLNKYAQKPSQYELIILDEDDAAAILSRRLLERHAFFKKQNSISESGSPNIPASEPKSFTNLITVYNINQILLKEFSINRSIRPENTELDAFYLVIERFWNFFLESFPEIGDFVDGRDVSLNGEIFNRNNDSGGSLLLRPVGQTLFAKMYLEMDRGYELNQFKEKLRLIDFRLSGTHWKYLFWYGGKIVAKNDKLKVDIFKLLLGKAANIQEVNQARKTFYRSLDRDYEGDIQPV